MFQIIQSLVSSILQIITPIISKLISWAMSNPFHALAGFVFVQLYSLVLGANLSLLGMAVVFCWGAVLYSGIKYLAGGYLAGNLPRLFETTKTKFKQIGEGQATAAWATETELHQANLFNPTDLMLGKWTGTAKSDRLVGWQQEGHLLTVAPTGAGKGVGVVIPNLLTYPGSVVAIDPKGENYQISSRNRRRMGQAVFRLDPFSVCCSKRQAKLNPLDLLDPETEDFADDALVIADMLVLRTGNEKDPHWDEKAIMVLQGLIMFVVINAPEKDRHLGEVRRLLTSSADTWDAVLEMMCEADGAIATAANQITRMAEEERASVLSTAMRHTSFLDSPQIVRSLSHSSFDPLTLKQNNTSLYLILPADKLATYSRLLRLWIATTLQVMIKVKSIPQHRVLFMLDEMAQLGTMQPLVKAISLMRGYHMTLWMILQDLGQLKSLYPDNLWQTFLSNSKIQQYFGVTDQETAEYVSKLAGETTVDVTSTTEGRNTGKSRKDFFDNTNSKGTNRGKTTTEQIRPLLRPDEVRRLPGDEQLIFIQGIAPIWANKLKYYQDAEFDGLYS